MMTFVCVVGIAMLFCAIYLLLKLTDEARPRCPRCGRKMEYKGTDESDREIWECEECGEILILSSY